MKLCWYKNEQFWVGVSPFLFTSDRRATVSIQVNDLLKMLDLKPGAAILDMCCGKGWFVVELAKRGFRVTGVDYTAAFIGHASRLAEQENVRTEFVEQDVMTFCRPGQYDAVISIFHSFGYHEREDENMQVLLNACESLVTGGTLLLDMLSREQVKSQQAPMERQIDGTRLSSVRNFDEGAQRVEDQWVIEAAGMKKEFRTSARLYSANEISSLLESSGFGDIHIFGDLGAAPYKETAGRLVVIARKRSSCKTVASRQSY